MSSNIVSLDITTCLSPFQRHIFIFPDLSPASVFEKEHLLEIKPSKCELHERIRSVWGTLCFLQSSSAENQPGKETLQLCFP